MPGPELEIVIVSSTGALDLLRAALQSLSAAPYTLGKQLVHVVDNASTDSTPDMVRSEFPEVRVHPLDWNAGFCVANNVALREVHSPYVLVLNPDTEVYPGALDHMMQLMEGDASIGVSTCRLELRDGTLDHACKRSFPTPAGALSHFLGLGNRFGGRFAQYQAPDLDERALGEVDAVNGAFMLIRKSAIDEVGLLDEGYNLYADDLDWCFRFKRAGWRVVYDGRVSSLHVKGGVTVTKRHRGLRHNVLFHRSMGRFYRKFYAGRNGALDVVIVSALAGKLVIAVVRSTIARRRLI